MAVSSGCTRMVGDCETTTPRAVTTWSTGIRPAAAIIVATIAAIIQVMPRAERGTGALAIAVEGHWNSRIAGKVGSLGSPRRRTNDSAIDVARLTARPAGRVEAITALFIVRRDPRQH